MFTPCVDACFIRHGKQYTEVCDEYCNYAKSVKDNIQKDYIVEYLLDMLEEEHIGMKTVARKYVKDTFGIDI